MPAKVRSACPSFHSASPDSTSPCSTSNAKLVKGLPSSRAFTEKRRLPGGAPFIGLGTPTLNMKKYPRSLSAAPYNSSSRSSTGGGGRSRSMSFVARALPPSLSSSA
jgi:hypothetical protein